MRSSIAVTLLATGLAAVSTADALAAYTQYQGYCAENGADVDVNEQDEGTMSLSACADACDDRSGCTAFEYDSGNCMTTVNSAINSGTGGSDADCYITTPAAVCTLDSEQWGWCGGDSWDGDWLAPDYDFSSAEDCFDACNALSTPIVFADYWTDNCDDWDDSISTGGCGCWCVYSCDDPQRVGVSGGIGMGSTDAACEIMTRSCEGDSQCPSAVASTNARPRRAVFVVLRHIRRVLQRGRQRILLVTTASWSL